VYITFFFVHSQKSIHTPKMPKKYRSRLREQQLVSLFLFLLLIAAIVFCILHKNRAVQQTQTQMTQYFQYPQGCIGKVHWRSSDGSDHGLPQWHGAAFTRLGRYEEPGNYTQHFDGRGRPNARLVSNELCQDTGKKHATHSALVWAFGQFVDHAISLSPNTGDDAAISISAPVNDAHHNGKTLQMDSTDYVENPEGYRQPFSIITHFVDGNVIYGSNAGRTVGLRLFQNGLIHFQMINGEEYPPYNILGLDNVGGRRNSQMFLLGDLRGNEQVLLTALHILFLREHNYQAKLAKAEHPNWSDECLFQHAKQIVVAELQKITYDEWLPVLLGEPLESATKWNASTDPRIYTEFSGCAYRLHSLVGEHLVAHNTSDGSVLQTVALKDAFTNTSLLVEHGPGAFLLGSILEKGEQLDLAMVDSLRNFLFVHDTAPEHFLDLAALNILRGRQIDVPDFATLRKKFTGLDTDSYADICASLATKLEQVYGVGNYNNVDAWIGLLAEDECASPNIGQTHAAILKDQFLRLRNADAFYYKWDEQFDLVDKVDSTTFNDLLKRNFPEIDDSLLPENPFLAS